MVGTPSSDDHRVRPSCEGVISVDDGARAEPRAEWAVDTVRVEASVVDRASGGVRRSGDGRSASGGRCRWVVLGGVWVVGAVCAVLFGSGDPVAPRFAPEVVGSALSADRASWTVSEDLEQWQSVDYGRVGSDGRLDRWAQLGTSPERFTTAVDGPPDRSTNGRLVWRIPGGPSEFRAVVEVPGCDGQFLLRAVDVDEPEMYDALASSRCDDGEPTLPQFAGMRLLCRTGSDRIEWSVQIPGVDPAAPASMRVWGSRDTCPLATFSGNNLGRDGFATLERGGRMLFNVDAASGRVAATFRSGPYSVHVVMTGPARPDSELLAELRDVLRGLREYTPGEWDRWQRERR